MKPRGIRLIALLFLGVLLVSLAGYSIRGYAQEHKQELLQNKIVQISVPLYRSLRKLPDIFFIVQNAFSKTDLETFELSISPALIERMNAQLPDNPFTSGLKEENKLWVNAYFRAPGYEGNVDVRYRGNLPAHWNAYQKSYLIKFPKSNLFRGMRELTMVIPSKRRYFAMSLNNYRAQKLGLFYPQEQFVQLTVNGANTGVLLAFEHWSQEWVEKLPISSLSTLYGLDEGVATYEERWKSWNSDTLDTAPLKALQEIVVNADDETFKRVIPHIIDVEDFLKWDTMFILAGGYHVTEESIFGDNNLILIFDRAEGRFKPVPYNTVLYTDSFREEVGKEGLLGSPTLLRRRLLAIPEFRAQRNAYVAAYIKANKDDDIAFVEKWRDRLDREFLMDNAKNANNFMYLSRINENAETVEYNFSDPYNALSIEYPTPTIERKSLSLPPEYKNLMQAIKTPQEFILTSPNFFFDGASLRLGPGIHVFQEDVIIPSGTRLVISPGAHIVMGAGASIFSYSPVTAEGAPDNPILFTSLTDSAWGVFAVLNAAGNESVFSHTVFEGGGEDSLAGIQFSGMLALHNADATVTSSVFRNAGGDDSLNIKGGKVVVRENVFEQNASDGIDIDYPAEGTILHNNSFANNKGDAIDLSWSTVEIFENVISRCGDKGISAGERSTPTIHNNVIGSCAIGIAIKDSSKASISENILIKNIIPIALYQKKDYFGGGEADVNNNTFSLNERDIRQDELSSTTRADNKTIELPEITLPQWVPTAFVRELLSVD